MTLPKVSYPLTQTYLESLGKKVNTRPMLVKEEKILLMAKQSGSDGDIFNAIKQIVGNCVIDEDFNIDDLPIYDLEYLFIRLRIQSIGKQVDLVYRDSEDNEEYRFTVNLEDIKVKTSDKKVNNKIKVSDDIGVVLRYPPSSLYDNDRFIDSRSFSDLSDELIISCIETIYDEENVYPMKDVKHEDAIEFLDSLSTTALKDIQSFLATAPHVEHIITYKNKNGTERKIVLRTINDFFTL